MKSAQQLRILAAGGDVAVRAHLKRVVEQYGGRVEEAATTLEALLRLRQHRFDLLFLDLIMPEPEGGQILRHVRERSAATHTVIISSLDDTLVIDDIVRAGAFAFLIKPLTDGLILETLSRVAGDLPEKIRRNGSVG